MGPCPPKLRGRMCSFVRHPSASAHTPAARTEKADERGALRAPLRASHHSRGQTPAKTVPAITICPDSAQTKVSARQGRRTQKKCYDGPVSKGTPAFCWNPVKKNTRCPKIFRTLTGHQQKCRCNLLFGRGTCKPNSVVCGHSSRRRVAADTHQRPTRRFRQLR